MKRAGAEFKALLQEQQVPAETYANVLGQYTMPRSPRLRAWTRPSSRCSTIPPPRRRSNSPALKPLLDQAAV